MLAEKDGDKHVSVIEKMEKSIADGKDALEKAKEKGEKLAAKAKDKGEEVLDKAKDKLSPSSSVTEKLKNAYGELPSGQEVLGEAKEVYGEAKEKLAVAKEKLESVAGVAQEKLETVVDVTQEKLGVAKEKLYDAKETLSHSDLMKKVQELEEQVARYMDSSKSNKKD